MSHAIFSDNKGTSAIEFAICLPFLVLLYTGVFQLAEGLSAYRKVTLTARTVGDLTAQYTAVSDADLDLILNASQQVLAPYPVSPATMTISQIKIDASGVSTVDWSRGKNCSGLVAGSAFTIPAAIKTPNTYLIVATLNYSFVPTFGAGVIGNIPLHDQIVLNPRATARITKS